MTYFLMALVCAFVGVIPLILKKRIIPAVILLITATLGGWYVFWLISADIVGPFCGAVFPTIIILWGICAAIDNGLNDGGISWLWIFPVVTVVAALIITPLGSRLLRSDDFAKLIGNFEERVWTQDIQPKSPQHIRLVNKENAIYRAQNSLKGEIGSQFKITSDNLTLQMIRGKLWFVAPLDFSSYGSFSSSGGVPCYIKVSAEDDGLEPEMVNLPSGKKFHYTPGAYFNHNLERHVRMNGYLNVSLDDFTLEIDEENNPWWVISLYQPTIFNSGEKINGVIIVDPSTGEMKPYTMEEIPSWVDRAIPDDFVMKYLGWWGEYKNGFMNTLPIIGNSKARVKPVHASLYYGSDNNPYWVTDITSIGADTSLVGIFYTNSRTGKSIFYTTDGGSISTAVQKAVNDNQSVKYQQLHAGDAQLYNLYGTMASVTSLLNSSHARQGVAIASVKDVQKVAVGVDVFDAVAKYQEIIGNHFKGSIEKARNTKTINGQVERIHQEISGNYQIYLTGIPHIFYSSKKISVKLPITEKGDKVKIEYAETEEASIPMITFDNLSVLLSFAPDETVLTEEAKNNQGKERQQNSAQTIRENLKNLSPEKLIELEKNLSK